MKMKPTLFVISLLSLVFALAGCDDIDCARIQQLKAEGTSFMQTAPDAFAVLKNGAFTGETIKADTFIRCR